MNANSAKAEDLMHPIRKKEELVVLIIFGKDERKSLKLSEENSLHNCSRFMMPPKLIMTANGCT